MSTRIILLENGIIKSQQTNQIENENSTRFITVQMEPCPASELSSQITIIRWCCASFQFTEK